METLQNEQITNAINNFPMEGMTKYHSVLATKFENVNPDNFVLNDDTKALMAFNGYYALESITGGFFTVDTNMHITSETTTPIFDISIILCLDGKTSTRVPFTGTFDGTTLTQTNLANEEISFQLTFAHVNNNEGIIANVNGKITFPNQESINISGSTYNNPIEYNTYIGEYFETVPFHFEKNSTVKSTEISVPVLKMDSDYKILFDFGTNDGVLQTVPSYTYNLNMYFFTFQKEENTYHLIMGTGADKGLVSNNMTTTIQKDGTAKVSSRNLVTIPFPSNQNSKPSKNIIKDFKDIPNLSSANELAKFSGYYSIPSIAPGAFISIQAEYIDIANPIDAYVVLIGVSLDGKTSKGFYFNEGMTFENGLLFIPSENISIAFNRTYNPTNKSLVSITGTIDDKTVNGFTLFNPVPLTAFKGKMISKAVKGKAETTLEVKGMNEIVLNGVTMKAILYVPIMYILAAPSSAPTHVFSFGTDGLKGNTCIITDVTTTPPTTSLVYAIHNEA